MRIVFKYLKSYWLIVLICLALLFGQAICDLTLPDLMSNIVNVGIQQSGVEAGAPEAVSEEGMTLLGHFMAPEDRLKLLEAYVPVKAGDEEYREKYPASATKNIYVLNEHDGKILEQAADIYSRAALGFMNFAQDMAAQSGQTGAYDSAEGLDKADMDKLYAALLPVLDNMPESYFAKYIADAHETDSMLHSQVGVTFTRIFYSELGVDLNKIQRSYIWKTGLEMLLVTLAGVAAIILVGYLASVAAASVARRMRHDIFAKVESFSSAEFDRFSTASLITRTTNDVMQVQMLVTMGLRMICYAPIMGVGGIIMAVNKSVSLSWIIAAAVAALFGLILVGFAIALPKFKSLQRLVDKLNLVSRENLSGMMVIRAFGNERHEEERFEKANKDLSWTIRFTQRTMAVMMPAMMLIMNCVTLVIIWVGGHAVAESTLQIGDMMAFMQYVMQIIMSFLMIAMMFIMVPRAAVSAGRIAEVLETENQILDPKTPCEPKDIKGEVEFRNVSFRYHNAEKNVLENISFTARPGETVAFIGSTGSGKSTLINLIPRFYDVTDGAVLIDGTDVRAFEQKRLRDNIGYVPQKGVLFSGDIASNIRYGRREADKEQIARAIEVAQASDFVNSLEEGINSPIAQGGDNVSGGQKQRLSIARALVKKPPIYIFDDSFSALDFKTDAALRRALSQYTGGATVFIVAQRVSTIMSADKIIVLDEGKMAGMGTHRELLDTCKTYREIAESQLSKEELQ